MLLSRLSSYLGGYVSIFISGEAPEKFVNMAASRGIYLWDITAEGGNLWAKTRLSCVRPLRHIARRSRCRFKIVERAGLPFYFRRLYRRKVLVLGAVFFIAALYFLTSFIWFIEVRGNDQLSEGDILAAARAAGLKQGAPKWKLDPAAVEARLKEELPLLGWSGVYIKGSRAVIEVSERVLPEADDIRPAHVVAAKDGLVKEILVLRGHAAVKEGETVSAGQVLISGIIPPPEEEGPKANGEKEDSKKTVRPPRYVSARGIVRARVWYENYAEVPLVESGIRPTGRVFVSRRINIAGKEIILHNGKNIPFAHCQCETYVKRLPAWRNITVPVELVTLKFDEIEEYTRCRERGEALEEARAKALEGALKSINPDAVVVGQWTKEMGPRQENTVRVKAVVEAVENIGRVEPFEVH